MYHIISGAASWDQFWGQSTEKDFDDVQKTIDYWTYQIASFDDAKGEMSVESYAIGSPKLGLTLNNELIDSFYRRKNVVPQARPSIITLPADSVNLPFTIESSAYSTLSSEPVNSTQFQISPQSDFSKKSVDLIRDYENLYGTSGSPDYKPVDIHKNIDILKYTIGWNKLPNGTYYVRARHRDRNLGWSDWSDTAKLTVKGSISGFTRISTPKPIYEPGEDIIVSYESGPCNAKDWIGIYRNGDTPGNTPSTDWEYTTGSSGTVTIQVPEPGRYFTGFFENDGYNEIADRIGLYITRIPVLTLDKAGYAAGESFQVTYTNAPGFANDWIGIYKLDDVPGVVGSTQWDYTSGTTGVLTFPGLTAGYYYVSYFLEDQYTEAGERVIFSVGSNLATLTVDQSSYLVGQSIRVSYENGPGTPMDWIGLFRQNPGPGIPPLVNRQFIPGKRADSLSFDGVNDPGEYYIALFINNSGIRISGKALFSVESGSSAINPEFGPDRIFIYPSPSTGRFILKISIPPSNDFYLRITSSTGAMVLERELKSGGTGFSEELDLSGSPAGLYMINVHSGSQEYSRKFAISR